MDVVHKRFYPDKLPISVTRRATALIRDAFRTLSNILGPSHIETSPLICSANQWTGFYMVTALAMKELSLQSQSLLKSVETSPLRQYHTFLTFKISQDVSLTFNAVHFSS